MYWRVREATEVFIEKMPVYVKAHRRAGEMVKAYTRAELKKLRKGSTQVRVGRLRGIITYHMRVGSRTKGEPSYFHWKKRMVKLNNAYPKGYMHFSI